MAPQQLASAALLADSPYTEEAVSTVPEVLGRLERIQAYAEAHEPRGQHDGIACFSALYHRITTRIWEEIASGAFRNPEFVAAVDVALANRYFGALRAGALQPDAVPAAWAPLLARRGDPRITRIQFAVAGVNAHLNVDLAVAIADTCSELHSGPSTGAKRTSYLEVNRIVTTEMQALRRQFESTWERLIDRVVFGRVLIRIDDWTAVTTRDIAWEAAGHIWSLRQQGDDPMAFVRGLERVAGEASRLVLVPVL